MQTAQVQEKKENGITAEVNVDTLIERTAAAQKRYAGFSQEQVDAIFRSAAMAANKQRIPLAKAAREETGMGIVEDKVVKNHFASEFIYNKYKDRKTCGVIKKDDTTGMMKVAEPLGVLAGVIPTTNPTSTTIFKALLALKTRNGIIFSPHPRAKACTIEAAKVVLDAAVRAGAPEGIISWIEEPSIEASQQLMTHSKITTILATGGPGMVKAAYSSGKPALGVGSGNTPAIIDETADIRTAVSSILMSKTFDNGMICASEQAVVAVGSVYEAVKKEFRRQGAYLLNAKERNALGNVLVKDGKLNGAIVGQPAVRIAELAGIDVPEDTKVLIGEVTKVAAEEPFAWEKLSPVLALYKVRGFEEALERADQLLVFGGLGHTAALYTREENNERIEQFGNAMKSGRTLINMPSSQGAIGDLYNFSLDPSLTLGCGSWGGNSVSENVGPDHLLNIKSIAAKRENMLWFQVPEKVYFKAGSLAYAMDDLAGKKQAFIVTDNFLAKNGYIKPLTEQLERLGIGFDVYADVETDPTLATARDGAERMRSARPDVIIAMGGGSPMDAAKIMWLLYENPEVDFEDMAMRFMDIRKRVYSFPEMGKKALFVAIPTTSGTGSEVTPFAVITDETTGMKYPIADYALTPDMAICDANLVKDMPASLTAFSGIDALTHALEAVVSTFATEYTTPMALEAVRLLFEYLPRAYENGPKDLEAREKVHHAANMAGMAFSNAFLGVCHSMAHKLGAYHHLPHGLANALLINEVIRYNAHEAPTKQGIFPQYAFHDAAERYARVAAYIGIPGQTAEERVDALIDKIDELKRRLDIPETIKEAGIDEAHFYKKLDEMAEAAYDDQCTGTNPRIPLIKEITGIYVRAFTGSNE
ncbi:MAG: bifunctional acetaldehyde-CoA/alcohol dehydrogenase [Spirochaetales bacterium]|nr:bifunctional acetaldehyde-CoA/alcohol dehydrogenase [Spirochaetales bacterium]MCF7939395.1 bifunctional acetaldehyde-CoA/alcohol dehydrogenase [Spirochaetales bacterium]